MVGQRLSLRARALSFLARRDHSRAELARKLQSHSDDPEVLKSLLDEFDKCGWLSEARFVEQTVHRLAPKFGTRRIAHTLREKGVSKSSIAAALSYLKDNELAAARNVLKRKYPVAPANADDRARQMRFLQGRGFAYEVIRKVIDVEEPE